MTNADMPAMPVMDIAHQISHLIENKAGQLASEKTLSSDSYKLRKLIDDLEQMHQQAEDWLDQISGEGFSALSAEAEGSVRFSRGVMKLLAELDKEGE